MFAIRPSSSQLGDLYLLKAQGSKFGAIMTCTLNKQIVWHWGVFIDV